MRGFREHVIFHTSAAGAAKAETNQMNESSGRPQGTGEIKERVRSK